MFPNYASSLTRRHECEKFGFGSNTSRSGGAVRPSMESACKARYTTFLAPSERVVATNALPRGHSAPANEHSYSNAVSKDPSLARAWRSVLLPKTAAAGSGSKTRFALPVPAVDGLAYCPESAAKIFRPSTAESDYPTTRPCSSTFMRDVWKLPFAPTLPTSKPSTTSTFKLSDRAASRDSFNWYTTVVTKSDVLLVARDGEEARSCASRPISYGGPPEIKKSFNSRIQPRIRM